MALDNYGVKILRENCRTFADRRELESVLESNSAQLDATMVSRLYKSAIDKSHVFDSWEDSKGDITKFEGYGAMRDSLNIVRDLAEKSGTSIKEITVVEQALEILEANRESFMKGFMINNELVILVYNSIAFACVEATSAIISSYVEFVRSVDAVEFTIAKNGKLYGAASIDNLEHFVKSSRKGDLGKLLKEATTNRDNFIGSVSVTTVAVSAFVLGAALSIIPIVRELTFLFYFSKSRLSEYLEQQAILIELNRKAIESSQLPLKERKEVLKKQEKTAHEFRRYSDKFRVNSNYGEREAVTAIKKENKAWTIEDTKKEMIEDSSNGFQLL